MKEKFILICLLVCLLNVAHSQRYFSKTAEISFFSSTPMEDIKAETNSASTVLDLSNGAVQWAVLIKSFEFKKALMQEHFNENYMESNKFPKAKFKGKMLEFETLDLGVDGDYTLSVEGSLEIHGVTQAIENQVQFQVKDGQLFANTEIMVKPADYDIEIPKLVRNNIAKEIKIEIQADYELFEEN